MHPTVMQRLRRPAAGLAHAWRVYRSAPRKRWLLRAALWPYQRRRDRTIVSPDGTVLSARRSGHGTPVVLVHGGLGSKDSDLLATEAALSDEYAVWSYDRRGHGRSGDADQYSLDREVDDLLAVVDAAGEPPHVVAHSFGAICAVMAARRGVSLRSLVLYEPPFDQHRRDERAVELVSDAVAQGELERALRTFFAIAAVTDDEIAVMRSMRPLWRRLEHGVLTLPREFDATRGLRWDPDRWSLPHVSVLLVAGSETIEPVFPTIDELREAFPDCRSVVIPGQGHLANGFAPWRFTAEVRDFISRH